MTDSKLNQKVCSYVPRELLSNINKNVEEDRFESVVAFADVSGFTAMSEKLTEMGREGAEILTSILNRYFTVMIDIVHSGGGFIGKFGGDAMTIFFPIHNTDIRDKVIKGAVNTSMALQAAMDEFQGIKTTAGDFSLGMKVGVATGNVLFKVVGSNVEKREFLLAGTPLDRAADAEHHATVGELVVSDDVAVISGIAGIDRGDGFVLLEQDSSIEIEQAVKRKEDVDESWVEIAKSFIDPAVYKRMILGLDKVGEIRRATIIFLAFSGFDYENDDQVGEKLETLYQWIMGIAARYDGSINKIDMGDKGSKIILTFGAPVTHENDAEMAVRCGLELVGGNKELAGWGITQRLGISTGPVFAGEVGSSARQEYTVMGSTVNLSARLMAHSEIGQLQVGGITYNLTKELFEYLPPVDVQFKGMKEPMPVYQVAGIAQKTEQYHERKVLPLTGRVEERGLVVETIKDCCKEGSKVLLIGGSPGTGKSRLMVESLTIAREMNFSIGAGEALSYAIDTPYLPWVSILRGLMGISGASETDEQIKTLEELVKKADPEYKYRTPCVAGLLGIDCPDNDITRHFDAKLRMENVFDFLVQYFKFISETSPVLVVFEDAQWIDDSSLELLNYLHRNLSKNPVIFEIVHRPFEDRSSNPLIAGIVDDERSVNISVSEFTRDETAEFIQSLFDIESISAELLDFTFDASHGNPSFIEVLLGDIKARNILTIVPGVDDEAARIEVTGDLSEVEVPDSLNNLIMSQIDRLQPEAKLTLQVAAVVGRRFAEEVLEEAYPVETNQEKIRQLLNELRNSDLILPDQDEEIVNYIFKNILTRDTAYESLLFAHRREFHLQVGLCLESINENRLAECCEDLARHFYFSEDGPRAVKYLDMAGNKSLDLFANENAISYYTRALERHEDSDDNEQKYAIINSRIKVYSVLGKREEQKNDLDEALRLAKSCGNPVWEVSTLDNLASYYWRIKDLEAMDQAIEEALSILETTEYPFGKINILSKRGQYHYGRNELPEAFEKFEASLEATKKINDLKGMSVALNNCGLCVKGMGDFDGALDYYNQALKVYRENSDFKSEGVALGNIAVLHHQRGNLDQALDCYQQALEISSKIGSKEIKTRNLGNLAFLYQQKGERERSMTMMQDKLIVDLALNDRRGRMLTLSNLGAWYDDEGEYDEALGYYSQAVRIANELSLIAEVPRLILNTGLALHHSGKLTEARTHLEDALTKASEAGTKLVEVYAHRYLGFLLIDVDDIEGAIAKFEQVSELAESLGDKGGQAAALIGLGYAQVIGEDDESMIDDAITASRENKDSELIIQGLVLKAKALKARGHDQAECNTILSEAAETAKTAGRNGDVIAIEKLLKN